MEFTSLNSSELEFIVTVDSLTHPTWTHDSVYGLPSAGSFSIFVTWFYEEVQVVALLSVFQPHSRSDGDSFESFLLSRLSVLSVRHQFINSLSLS